MSEEKKGVDGRVYRSATFKCKVLDAAAVEGASTVAVCEKFGVLTASFYQWRKVEPKLRKLAKKEAKQAEQGNGPAPVEQIQTTMFPPKASPKPVPPEQPITARSVITGLGPLIADVRATVISELAEEVGGKLAELIDARMPDIVSRELRKLLTEQTLPTGQVHPIRPIAKRA